MGRKILAFLLYWSMALFTFMNFASDPGVNVDPRNSLPAVVSGQGHRPFVYRALTPLVVRGIDALFVPSSWEAFKHYRWAQEISHEQYRAQVGVESLKQWYIFKWLSIACLMGFGWAMYLLIRRFYAFDPFEAHALALLSIAYISVFLGPANQLYDPMTLLLFPWAFVFLCQRWLWAYYVVFLLAVVNKELSFLLIPLFVLVGWQTFLSKSALLAHAALQGVLWIAVVGYIRWWFADYPGSLLEDKWVANAIFLTTPSIALLETLVKWSTLIYLVVQGWKEKDRLLRHAFLLLALPLLGMVAIAGRVSELRACYEVLFLFYLLAIPTLKSTFTLSTPASRAP